MLLNGIFLFLMGCVCGSFISALTYRYPRGISVLKGRSLCPKCKKQIFWYDNIPLVSFLILKGKCRNCKKKISSRYPLIELISGIGFTLIGVNILYLILFLLLETIFIIDLEHQIIPDELIFIGILVASFTIGLPIYTSLFSGFLASLILLILHLATRGRGMGLGDVKFAILGGILVGLKLNFIWLFLSFLTGGLVGIILILGKKAGLKDKIAFGPFLIIAIPIALLWGKEVLRLLLLR